MFGTNPIAALAAGASTTFTFTHEDNPAHGGFDYSKTATLRATSQTVGATTVTLVGVESQFKNYEVAITPAAPVDSVLVGDPAVVYTFTVENVGGLIDSYDVTVTGDGVLSVARIENLAPAATTIVTLTHSTAVTADLVGTVKIESDFDSGIFDTAVATTKVATYGVSLTPDPNTETVLSGDDAVHTITIENTGSHSDTFDLTVTDNDGLTPVLSVPSITVAAGATDTFTLTFTAPAAGLGYSDTVTATSTLDPSVTKASDTLAAVTNVNTYGVTVLSTSSPLTIRSGLSGVQTFTVENTGNVVDTYTLTLTGDLLASATVPATVTVAAGGTGTVTMTLTTPPAGLGATTNLEAVSQGAPIVGGAASDNDDAVTNVKTYGVTVVKTGTAKDLSEVVKVVGGTEVHTFTVTNNGNDVDTFDIVKSGDDTLSDATLIIASGATDTFTVTHDTSAEGVSASTVTITSQGYVGATDSVTAKTFAVDAGSHVTDNSANGVGVFNLDATATVPFEMDVDVTGAISVDFYKLPGNPRPEATIPKEKHILFGTFTVDDKSRVTTATGTVHYTQVELDTVKGKESELTVYYWDETQWVEATGKVLDVALKTVTFDIEGTNWLDRSYDYDFVLATAKKFFSSLPVVPILPPAPEIPDDATPEEVGDAILDATEGESADVVAETIITETVDKTTEETADIVLTVTASKTVEDTASIVQTVTATKTVTESASIIKTVTAQKTNAETATITKKAVESKSGADAGSIVKDVVTEKNSEQASEVIVEVIKDRPVTEKATVVLAQTKENAAKTMDKITTTEATEIMDSIVPDVEDLNTATDEVKAQVSAAADMMNEVDKDKAGEMLLQSTSAAKAKNIVQEMAKSDITKAATRLEEAVKIQKRTGEITVEQKNAYRKQLKDIVEAGDAEGMANLFVAIANLPETPSTVAEIFEIIDIGNAMTIIDFVSAQGSHRELALVYSFLSDAKLTEIWTAMTSAVRTAVYPYFDAVTLGNLPELTTFAVSVSVSPSTVETGEPVTATATVTNTGDETGDIWITMTEGSTEESEIVTLDAGASTTLTWTITKTVAGSYTVDVNGDSASWTVEVPPTPAAFTLSNLSVSPASIQAGEDVTVTVEVENTGEESGSTTVEVELDGVEADSELVTLNGGASTTVSFTVTSETEGAHTVEVGSLSGDFTVEEAPPGTPWATYLIVVVVIAAAAYIYMQQQKKEE